MSTPTLTLPFVTVRELRARTPEEPAWLWQNYIAPGNLTLLAGKPKAGKSTLALALTTALSTGADSFLGCATRACPVVYVSEEASPTLLHKLPADDANLHVLTRDAAWPRPDWPQLVAGCVTHARSINAGLLVIDTAAFWMALAAKASNDTGSVQAVMKPLEQATHNGLAVLLVTHSRKAGGEDGDAVGGSVQWTASVDTVLELERPHDNAPASQRLLLGAGRHPATPPCALADYDQTTGSWALGGHAEDRHTARVKGRQTLVLDALASGASLTRNDLEQATGAQWRDLLGTINALISERLIKREGLGRAGHPYRYGMSVGTDVNRHPTDPTDPPGSEGQMSVVCSVGTPQTLAAASVAPVCVETATDIRTEADRIVWDFSRNGHDR